MVPRDRRAFLVRPERPELLARLVLRVSRVCLGLLGRKVFPARWVLPVRLEPRAFRDCRALLVQLEL